MRHVIGYLNRPTVDGRVVKWLQFKEPTPVVHDQTYVHLGVATDFYIDCEGVISCVTEVSVQDDEVLSMQLQGTMIFDADTDSVHVSNGEIRVLVRIPRSSWAWS